MNKLLIWGVVIGLVLVGGYLFLMQDRGGELEVEETEELSEEAPQARPFGELFDVTEGPVLGVDTKGLASGSVQAYFEGEYVLRAAFNNLPDPLGTDFYEGWVVRRGENFDFISTGALEKVDGEYVNEFRYPEDITEYNFYVLTIEPDDGDPAPAEHVVEGEIN